MTGSRRPGPALDGERLAGIHLQAGSLALARSELEALASRGAVSAIGHAVLAEARWRGGDLERAAEAAAAHQAAGGGLPIAAVILAEAAAVAGDQDEATRQMGLAGAGAADAPDALDRLFAGMPRRAAWPTATVPAAGDGPTAGDAPTAGESGSRAGATDAAVSEVDEEAPRSRRRAPAPAPAESFPAASDLVTQARDDMRSGDPERMTAAFSRLTLALRLDQAQAVAIADLLARRSEPAALLVRGDALRSAGRAIESEAAYAAAARALAGRVRRGS